MPLENDDYIGQLVPGNPPNSDNTAEGAAQIRLTKKATVQTFPNLDGEVTCAPADLNQLTGVLLGELMPVGAVIMWATKIPPNGWLECNGLAIPPANTALIALIGLNAPNLSNKFVRGSYDDRDPLMTETENVGAHSHSYDAFTASQIYGTGGIFPVATQKINGLLTSANPVGENRPANTAMMYIIKT